MRTPSPQLGLDKTIAQMSPPTLLLDLGFAQKSSNSFHAGSEQKEAILKTE